MAEGRDTRYGVVMGVIVENMLSLQKRRKRKKKKKKKKRKLTNYREREMCAMASCAFK